MKTYIQCMTLELAFKLADTINEACPDLYAQVSSPRSGEYGVSIEPTRDE